MTATWLKNILNFLEGGCRRRCHSSRSLSRARCSCPCIRLLCWRHSTDSKLQFLEHVDRPEQFSPKKNIPRYIGRLARNAEFLLFGAQGTMCALWLFRIISTHLVIQVFSIWRVTVNQPSFSQVYWPSIRLLPLTSVCLFAPSNLCVLVWEWENPKKSPKRKEGGV